MFIIKTDCPLLRLKIPDWNENDFLRVRTIRPSKSQRYRRSQTFLPGRSLTILLTPSFAQNNKHYPKNQAKELNYLHHFTMNNSSNSNQGDGRPSLVCLSDLSRSARSLNGSARSLETRSTSGASDTSTVTSRPARRMPPRSRTHDSTASTASGGVPASPMGASVRSSGRRAPPRRSVSQRFHRKPVMVSSDDFDQDDSGDGAQ